MLNILIRFSFEHSLYKNGWSKGPGILLEFEHKYIIYKWITELVNYIDDKPVNQPNNLGLIHYCNKNWFAVVNPEILGLHSKQKPKKV